MRGAFANGDEIRDARVRRGLTQEQLAGQAEMDVKTVRKAERGRRMDVKTLVRLALTLDVDVESVIHASDPEIDAEIKRRNVVERWIAAWDTRDMDAILALYHDSSVLHLPGAAGIPFSGSFHGKTEIRRANELAWSTARTVPDQNYRVFSGDDSVVVYGMKGICAPDGSVIRLRSVHIFTFDGELIIEHHVEYDTLALRRILEPPPDDPAAD